MYRIMLADDEGIVRDSLRFIIEKNFKDECQIETAKTGRQVIELAEHYRPDIAFMDIQMPGINGIEAIREIQQTNPNVIFIILSAYDKFLYAKEAISLGVLEYLNKPVNQKVVVEVIQKAIKQIDARRERQRNDLIVKEKLETVIPILENGFVSSIMMREYFEEDVENYKQLLNIETDYGYMMAIVFGETQQGNYMTNAVGTSVKTQGSYKIVAETFKEKFNCVVGSIMSNKIAIFVPSENRKKSYNERIELIETCREISRKLQRETGIAFRIGIGTVRKLQETLDSYQEGLKALINCTSRVAHVDDMPLVCQYEENYPIELEKNIFAELQSGNIEKCVQACNDYYEWMNTTYGELTSSIKLKVLEFVLFAEQDAYLSGGMTYHFADRQDYLPTVMEFESSHQLRKWFLDKMERACKNVVVKKEEHNNSIIENAKLYIQYNYQKEISLDDVSREMNLSPYYFSKLFKEETGENFIEYLTGIRITKAKELLMNQEMSMKEICCEVGYCDPNYFSRIFKKTTGITPTEYRSGIN